VAEDGVARLGRGRGPGAAEEHAAGAPLERRDPLAHRRGRQAQGTGGRIQRAGVDDGGQGAQVLDAEVHHQRC
jgi:hypothetical protein